MGQGVMATNRYRCVPVPLWTTVITIGLRRSLNSRSRYSAIGGFKLLIFTCIIYLFSMLLKPTYVCTCNNFNFKRQFGWCVLIMLLFGTELSESLSTEQCLLQLYLCTFDLCSVNCNIISLARHVYDTTHNFHVVFFATSTQVGPVYTCFFLQTVCVFYHVLGWCWSTWSIESRFLN